MGKKGNVIGITLVLLFFVTSFFGIVVSYSKFINNKIYELEDSVTVKRLNEIEIYEFFISETYENDKYIRIDNYVYIFDNPNIYYEFYIEDEILKMKKGDKND